MYGSWLVLVISRPVVSFEKIVEQTKESHYETLYRW